MKSETIHPSMLTDPERKLLQEITGGHNPVCIHILGQPLADALTNIIREQTATLHADAEVIAAYAKTIRESAMLLASSLNDNFGKPEALEDQRRALIYLRKQLPTPPTPPSA